MKKEINYLSEEELLELDPTILEDYLLQLESIDAGLNEYIIDAEVKNIDENCK